MEINWPHESMVGWVMVFSVEIPNILASRLPVDDELALFYSVLYPIISHINCFGSFFCFVLLEKPTAVVSSTCIGVGVWGCPISSRAVRIGIASCLLVYKAPIYASAAETITLRSIFVIKWMGPLSVHLAGSGECEDKKKCPPARLLSFRADK